MSKYEAWFCECGRIHIMNKDKYDWLAQDFKNREIIRVCQNCGTTRRTFLDEYFDDEYGCGFIICDNTVKEGEYSFDSNTKVIFSRGIRVPMKGSCQFATCCSRTGVWFDEDNNAGEVDVERLIKDIKAHFKDEAEEVLNSISGYVSGIDWEGTPYSYEEKRKRPSVLAS